MTVLATPAPAPAMAAGRGVQVHPVSFFLALLALFLTVSDRLLQDPDTHWHIAVGRWIWTNRAVPWTDTFSHTFAGAPWIAKEWLSQLVLYAALETAGWRGVAFLTAIVVGASFTLLFTWLSRHLYSTAALVLTLAAIGLAAPGCLARPHALVFPVVILWIIGLVDAVERCSPPPWWLVPLMAAWANLHGSFTIGFPIAGIMAAAALASVPAEHRAEAALRWGLLLVAVVVAGLVTPYGYRAIGVALSVVGSGEALPYIQEWRPLALDGHGIAAASALALILVGLGLRPRENLFRIVLVALLGCLMLKHVRFVGLFALVTPVVVAGPLVRLFPCCAASFRDREAETVHRLIAAGLALAVLVVGLLKSPEPSPLTTPAAALDAARSIGIAGPVYNDYDFGGFLIAKGVRTFIDGRTDQLFLGGFITRWANSVAAEEDGAFSALLAEQGVTWALVKPTSQEARHLGRMPDWRLAYADATAAVYLRD